MLNNKIIQIIITDILRLYLGYNKSIIFFERINRNFKDIKMILTI